LAIACHLHHRCHLTFVDAVASVAYFVAS
jgi:hypothetical protein